MIIDVSEHNGKLNWEKIKPEIEGAIIRCGFGSDYSKQDDAYFERNCSECERLGIPYGVYIYSYANAVNKAKSEANHVKRLIKGKKLSLPIFYDLEEERYSSYATKMANTWLDEMEGYEVGIYANVNWWKNYLSGVKCDKKWVAYWGSKQPSISGMVLLQYSDNGKVAGISGFDLNKNIGLKFGEDHEPEKPAEPEKPTKTVDELAKEVIDGKWGNGADRRKALEAAGYSYDEVQKRVNEMLGIGSAKSYKVIAQRGLNVRKGAGTNYGIIRVLPYGATVKVYEKDSGWGRIGNGEWVSMNYLQ